MPMRVSGFRGGLGVRPIVDAVAAGRCCGPALHGELRWPEGGALTGPTANVRVGRRVDYRRLQTGGQRLAWAGQCIPRPRVRSGCCESFCVVAQGMRTTGGSTVPRKAWPHLVVNADDCRVKLWVVRDAAFRRAGR